MTKNVDQNSNDISNDIIKEANSTSEDHFGSGISKMMDTTSDMMILLV